MTTVLSEEDARSIEDYQLTLALAATGAVIGRVAPAHQNLPTPCSEFDVGRLVHHIVGWSINCADKASGVDPAADAAMRPVGASPEIDDRAATARTIEGYRGEVEPKATPVGFVLLETVTHGWDLVTELGQGIVFPDEVVHTTPATGRGMLKPKHRGEGQAFGAKIAVPPDASAIEHLVAFMGRNPRWSAVGR